METQSEVRSQAIRITKYSVTRVVLTLSHTSTVPGPDLAPEQEQIRTKDAGELESKG